MADDMMRCERCFGRGYTCTYAATGGLKSQTCRRCRGAARHPHPTPAPDAELYRNGTWVQAESVLKPRAKTGRKFRALFVDSDNVQHWVRGTARRNSSAAVTMAKTKDFGLTAEGFLVVHDGTLFFKLFKGE